MSGNLAKENSQLASLIHSLGFELWNSGGQGLGNSNFNEAFGKVEVFGADSVRLSIVDLHGVKVASKTIPANNTVVYQPDAERQQVPKFFVYPQPARNYCWLLTSLYKR